MKERKLSAARHNHAAAVPVCLIAACIFILGQARVRAADEVTASSGGQQFKFSGLDQRAIQAVIDKAASLGGGIVELSDGEYHIDDAIYLRNNVTLRGHGEKTILVKSDAVRVALAKDALTTDATVTVVDAGDFKVGMGVTVDDEKYLGLVPVRTITAITGNELKLSRPLDVSLYVEKKGFVQNAFPVIWGVEVENVAVENLTVDGNLTHNPMLMLSWNDSGINLLKCRKGHVSGCEVRQLNADGISLNMSHDLRVEHCVVHDNARLGIHVGAGSLRAVVKANKVYANGGGPHGNRDGIYLCWDAQYGLYQDNEVYANQGAGITIGHGDGRNLFTGNVIRENKHGGIIYRKDTNENSLGNFFFNCTVENNQGYGFYIRGAAENTMLIDNVIRDTRPGDANEQTVGVFIDGVKSVTLANNQVEGHSETNIKVVDPEPGGAKGK